MIPNITLTPVVFKLKGKVDEFPSDPSVGDVVIKNGNEFVYAGAEWIELGSCENTTNHDIPKQKEGLIKLECSSCGGQLVKEGNEYVCKHCGFKYRWGHI